MYRLDFNLYGKKILVTGGAGHIGGALCGNGNRKNTHVTILDDLSTGSKNKLPSKEFSNYDFIQVDVNNTFFKEQIFGKIFDYVFIMLL